MSITDRVNGRSVAIGAATGTAAYLLGYLIVYVTQRNRIEGRLETFNLIADLFGGDPIPAWRAVGWVFYNAHFVATEIPRPFGGVRVENFIASADDGSLTLLYLVPPVLLLAAGFAAASLVDVDVPGEGATIGALATVGYFPLAIGGAFLFRYAVGEGTIAPDPVTAILLAGAVLPLVFGAVGGGIAGVVRANR